MQAYEDSQARHKADKEAHQARSVQIAQVQLAASTCHCCFCSGSRQPRAAVGSRHHRRQCKTRHVLHEASIKKTASARRLARLHGTDLQWALTKAPKLLRAELLHPVLL